MVSSASLMDPTRRIAAFRAQTLHWQLALACGRFYYSPYNNFLLQSLIIQNQLIRIPSQKILSQYHLTFLSLLFLNNKYSKKFNGNIITALIIPITTSSKEYPLNPTYKSTCPSGATPNHVAFTAIQLNTSVTTHVARCTRVNLHLKKS